MSSGPVLIMAGGTGGHVYPALAVAEALMAQSRDVVWLGTRQGIEARVVPNAGIDIEWISIQGVRRKGLLTLVVAPIQILRAVWQSLSVIRRRKPAAVLGMGGFVSGPGGLAAWLARLPLIIHEQNAIPGLTNRLLSRLARVVLQAFPNSFQCVAETVGNPVRPSIASIAAPNVRLQGRSGPARLLVLGGSQGALALNRDVPKAIALIPEARRPLVKHQCGARTITVARDAYLDACVDAELFEFIDDMAEAYAWADVVVCRAGALTVAELCAVGLPSICVPYPAAVDDHQTANAAGMVQAGAAVTIQESELTPEKLAAEISRFEDRDLILQRAERARGLAVPDSLQRITTHCLAQAGGIEVRA